MSDTLLERCRARRARVLRALGERAAMILPAAPELRVGRDVELRYQPDPELYYLTACTEPEAVAVLAPGADTPFTLFVRPRDPGAELWTGPRGGPEEAKERFAADAALPIADLDQRLPELVAGADTLYFRLGSGRAEVELAVTRILAEQRRGRQRRGRGAHALLDPGSILDDMRVVKDALEIERIRRAAEITADGFRAAAAAIRAGAGEWMIEAEIEAAFRRAGAQGPAFPTIVAAGPNAAVLHYTANARPLRQGELVLVDAGARFEMYAGDASRTFPVDGRFTDAQRELYELVLAAHAAALAHARPGSSEAAMHDAAVRVLVEGLVALGMLEGDPDDIRREKERYAAFYPHRSSHWLGLEVHDVGDYASDDDPRPLEAGMVLTLEPGLYLAPGRELPQARRALAGTGIRVEDDILITEGGHEVLTAGLPRGADAVEDLLG